MIIKSDQKNAAQSPSTILIQSIILFWFTMIFMAGGRGSREHGNRGKIIILSIDKNLKEVDYFPGFRDETVILEDLKISHR